MAVPDMSSTLPRYDIRRDYAWNYAHAPEPVEMSVPPFPGEWTFLGYPVDSPLGIPAGPLLNGRWILYYASLGFDVLTYKTVRSLERPCYAPPNLVPVDVGTLTGDEGVVRAAPTMRGSWAVSFGMPSASPDVWRRDVEQTRRRLSPEKRLVVSVVGTALPDGTLEALAEDYARCAQWAVESGADAVEANLSCPNVTTLDGQLYRDPDAARLVARTLRHAIGTTPLILKIGHLTEPDLARRLVEAVAPFTQALAVTNSVAARVQSADGQLLFDGQPRGICGAATLDASLTQTRLFKSLIDASSYDVKLIGVGGVSNGQHVRAYLAAGAESVHLATAAMIDPLVAVKIRSQL